MPISLILTPFDHFHFRPAFAVKCIPDLRVRLNLMISLPNLVSFLGNLMISLPNHLKPGFFSRRAIGEAVEAALSIETSSAFSGS